MNSRISFSCVHHGPSRLIELVRKVNKSVPSLDKSDFVISQDRRKNCSKVVSLRDHLLNAGSKSDKVARMTKGERIKLTSASKTAM